MNEQQVRSLIQQELKNSFNKRIGDTPTDALQLVNKKYVDGKVSNSYAGKVNSNGTGNFLPSGWTSSVGGIGGKHYTVTHNLNTTNYSIAGFPTANIGVLDITYSANSADIVILNLSGAAQNWDFNFILAVKK